MKCLERVGMEKRKENKNAKRQGLLLKGWVLEKRGRDC